MSDTVLVELIRNNLITRRVIDAFFYGHNRKILNRLKRIFVR